MKLNELPTKIPVFPLSNFIMFPGTTVPLNIFEPRYLQMVNDSMKKHRMIGIYIYNARSLSTNIRRLSQVFKRWSQNASSHKKNMLKIKT